MLILCGRALSFTTKQFREVGLPVDSQTIVALISACRHASHCSIIFSFQMPVNTLTELRHDRKASDNPGGDLRGANVHLRTIKEPKMFELSNKISPSWSIEDLPCQICGGRHQPPPTPLCPECRIRYYKQYHNSQTTDKVDLR
jgi:hypothetical protein